MLINIDDLHGYTRTVELESVGAVCPDDDVIYFDEVPFKLSSARDATTRQTENEIADLITASEKNLTAGYRASQEPVQLLVALGFSITHALIAIARILNARNEYCRNGEQK